MDPPPAECYRSRAQPGRRRAAGDEDPRQHARRLLLNLVPGRRVRGRRNLAHAPGAGSQVVKSDPAE